MLKRQFFYLSNSSFYVCQKIDNHMLIRLHLKKITTKENTSYLICYNANNIISSDRNYIFIKIKYYLCDDAQNKKYLIVPKER